MSSGLKLQEPDKKAENGEFLSDSATESQLKQGKALDECVICLQPISERAVAVPCNHLSFDFICLASWLQENHQCPLCKIDISAVQYDFRAPDDYKTYYVPKEKRSGDAPNPSQPSTSNFQPHLARFRNRQHTNRRYANRRAHSEPCSTSPDAAIQRRRFVYREQLYSLHVGSNRLSRFKDFTPQTFARSSELQARARKWIRRELQVFDFLSPDSTSTPSTAAGRRRAENVEFVLLYIIAILKTVDIKGSSGKAEEMLQAYLGEDNARLFLHELEAWLRSPYNALEDWDRAVQYRVPLPRCSVGSEVTSNNAPSTPVRGKQWPERSRNGSALGEDLRVRNMENHPEWQQATRRYQPD